MDQPTIFLSLPAEVRLKIDSYLFADEWVYIDPYVYPSPTLQQKRNRKQQYGAPILQTCRHLRDEAGPCYFASVRVCFDLYKGIRPVGLINWLDDIGETNTKMRKFEIRWNEYVDLTLDFTRQHNRHTHEDSTLNITNPVISSTRSTQTAATHTLTIQGIPEHEPEYWKRMGTREFCEVLGRQLSAGLEGRWEGGGRGMGKRELMEFVAEVDGHAGALRWLWFW